jgi:diguanylate cyclase (GGDEF)-like protein
VSLKVFHAVLVAIFATVIALSLAWEFWLEDWLLPSFVSYHEGERLEERWESVSTAAFFSFLALIGPAIIGTRLIQRDQVLRQTVIRLSQEDYLTGLHNRRWITELLESELRRATRYNTALSIILMDVDHFKAVNDRHGHQAGDRVLIRIAEVIRSSVRATDLVGRWGGEEFMILSPETGLDGGFWLAEKIRTRVKSADLDQLGHITASFGVTAFAEGDNIEEITARADAGLYAAKQGGRNRVEKVCGVAKKVAGVHGSHHTGSGSEGRSP